MAGIIILDGIILPLIFYSIIKRIKNTKEIPSSIFFKLYSIGIVIFPLLLLRKHLEYWLATKNPTFLFILLVVQMINNFVEEGGKLITLYVGVEEKFLKNYVFSIILGLFAGMSYGIGEAFTLSIIGLYPTLGKIFGINLTLLFMTWSWVLERFYAILIHTLIGGFVGIALYYFKQSNNMKAILFFLAGVIYHELVDGLILYASFHQALPFSRFVMKHIYDVILPVLILVGTIWILILFSKKEVEP